MRRYLLLVVIITIALLPQGCGSEPDTSAMRRTAKENLHSISVALEVWAADHGGRYPAAARVNADGVWTAAGMDGDWPTNPWTGRPVTQGSDPGDFSYERSLDDRSRTLTLHGVDEALMRVPLGASAQ